MKKYTENNDSIYAITSENVLPVELEETMSLSESPFNYMEISSHEDWTSVNKWATRLFKETDSKSIDSLYRSIVGKEKNINKKATLIIDYVQNVIRYTSVNGGIGSIMPSPPEEVIKRNYGDCKDKSLLTIQLLKRAGVDYVFPALVNTVSGKFLDKNIAGHSHFDHVIIKAKIDNDIMWLDPSLYLQGGKVTSRHSYNYGMALVIDGISNSLEKMNTDAEKNKTEIIEFFDFPSVTDDATLQVKTRFYGKNADYIRTVLDHYSVNDLDQQFKETYSTIFLDVTTSSKLEISDNYEENIITTTENYIIKNAWQKIEEFGQKGYVLTYEPLNVYNYVTPLACDKKKYIIDIDKSISFSQKTHFNLPKDAIYKLNNFETSNATYEFKKEQKIIDISTSEINYDIFFKTDQISPEDFYEYCEDVNHDARNLVLNIVWIQN